MGGTALVHYRRTTWPLAPGRRRSLPRSTWVRQQSQAGISEMRSSLEPDPLDRAGSANLPSPRGPSWPRSPTSTERGDTSVRHRDGHRARTSFDCSSSFTAQRSWVTSSSSRGTRLQPRRRCASSARSSSGPRHPAISRPGQGPRRKLYGREIRRGDRVGGFRGADCRHRRMRRARLVDARSGEAPARAAGARAKPRRVAAKRSGLRREPMG